MNKDTAKYNVFFVGYARDLTSKGIKRIKLNRIPFTRRQAENCQEECLENLGYLTIIKKAGKN